MNIRHAIEAIEAAIKWKPNADLSRLLNRITPMKIHKTEISEAAIRACLVRMKSYPFKASDIAKVALANGVPEKADQRWIAASVADRLIQREKAAGNITVGSPYPTWTWRQK